MTDWDTVAQEGTAVKEIKKELLTIISRDEEDQELTDGEVAFAVDFANRTIIPLIENEIRPHLSKHDIVD